MPYEILDVVGDVNPLQYGGWLIGSRDSQVDCLVVEPIDWEDAGKKGEGVDCLTYHVALDRMKVVGDVVAKQDCLVDYGWDNTWVGDISTDRREWWDSEEFRAQVWSEFEDYICSPNPVHRAWAWQEIANYYGIQNLDDCPQRETEAVLRKRFALPFYRARKQGITVYC